jgi:phosphoribosylformylglycinamidine (FGAM) synthase PurS component
VIQRGEGRICSKKLSGMSCEEVAQVEQGEVLQLLQQQRNSEPRP